MAPSKDKYGFHEKLLKIISENDLKEGEYIKMSGNPLNIPSNPNQPIISTVIAPSGYIGANSGIQPIPSGIIALVRTARDDRKDKELNIDDRYFWSDINKVPWSEYVCPGGGIHGQEYYEPSGLGNLARYEGLPFNDRGLVNELKATDFSKSLPPY